MGMKSRKTTTCFYGLCLTLVLLAGLVGACTKFLTTLTQSSPASTSASIIANKKIILKFALQSFPTEIDAIAIDDFANSFNERAQGKAEIMVFGNRSLGLSTQYLDMVKTGAVEIAELPLGVIEEASPVFIAPSLPFMFNNRASFLAAREPMAEAVFNDVLEKKYNQKPILWFAGGEYNLGSVNKSIKTTEDMKNILVAAAAPVQFSILKALGASAVNVAGPELYGALEKGVVDAVLIPSEPAVKMKLSEVMHYWTVCEMHTSFGCVTINLEVFNNLTEDLKVILFEEGIKCGDSLTERIIAVEDGSSEQLRKSGVKFYTLPADERAKWEQACHPIWDDYIQKVGADGEKLISIAEEADKANR
jgi:TRAP-type C4-dicarboxylate transport system substrate-binding protein